MRALQERIAYEDGRQQQGQEVFGAHVAGGQDGAAQRYKEKGREGGRYDQGAESLAAAHALTGARARGQGFKIRRAHYHALVSLVIVGVRLPPDLYGNIALPFRIVIIPGEFGNGVAVVVFRPDLGFPVQAELHAFIPGPFGRGRQGVLLPERPPLTRRLA